MGDYHPKNAKKKLAPWKRRYLNKAGRVVLIRSSLESLAVYFMSLHHIPVSVEKRLNTTMRRFLWGEDDEHRKMSWVSFKCICRPKKKGGLGIRSLRLVNKSLLVKWLVRYCTEKTALWRRIVCEKSKGEENCLLPLQVKQPVCKSMWFDILTETKVFCEYVKVRVKSGDGIRFWQDNWCGKIPFRMKYPRLYMISRQKNARISEIFAATWNFTLILDPAERIDMLELRYDVRQVRRSPGEDDCLEGPVSAKEFYLKLSDNVPDWEYERVISSKYAPPKVLFLFWACMHESLPTRFMLLQRGVVIQSNLCLLCNTEVETLEHLFLHCEEVRKIWNYFLGSLNTGWVMPLKFRDLMLCWWLDRASEKRRLYGTSFHFLYAGNFGTSAIEDDMVEE